jgi:lipopolysaccharide transport system permease protein
MEARNEIGIGPTDAQGTGSSRPHAYGLTDTLPEAPLRRIRPGKAYGFMSLREIWAHRELLLLLIWSSFKLRYRQTLLGAAWVILQPLLLMLVFLLFLRLLGQPPMENVPHPLFLYAGLLLWTFFANAVLGSSHSLVAQAELIRKVYFPRALLPMATVGVRLSDFIVSFTVLICLIIYYGVYPAASVLLLPLAVFNLVLLATVLGICVAALNIKHRDVGTLLPVLLQVCMFVSPVLYPSSLVPERWLWLYRLNPLVGIIEAFRASLFNLAFDWSALLVSFIITLCLFFLVSFIFRRLEDEIADVI